ncbi:MAG: carph-isopro domain-containing protein, partial [Alphaproteobacteria bacterium]
MTEDHERDATDAGGVASPGQLRALPLIERFGGIRPMAARLGVAVSTVQGWKQRDAVPAKRLEAIRR